MIIPRLRKSRMSPNQSEISSSQDPEPDAGPNNDQNANRPQSKSRYGCVGRFFFWLIAVLILAAAGVWYTLTSAQQLPEYYAQALEQELAIVAEDGKEFERSLIQLRNTARQRKPWIVEITQEQINGWLCSDLPEKFPDSLPAEITDPRAFINQENVQIAFKYTVSRFTGVVVISANIYCTEKPNELALQLVSVKTGFLPLPVGPWLDRVTDTIRKAGISIFWTQSEDGTPTAIFTLPEQVTTTATHHVSVEAVDLRPGKLVIAGKTTKTIDEEQQKNIDKLSLIHI